MPPTDPDRRQRLTAAVETLGSWEPPHNINLGDGVWTITDQQPVENSKLRRVVQLVADGSKRPLTDLRILDLACEGGIYGIELARLGATVVAVEGRKIHVERARFAAAELGLDHYSVEQGDVRDVSVESHGRFDVVLCLGILYHLDAPDVFDFVHAVAGLCSGLLVLDTSVSLKAAVMREHRGNQYWGRLYREHSANASRAQRAAKLRASLDNTQSFWPTRASLYNLVRDAGFTSVLEARSPRPYQRYEDQLTLVAHRGTYQAVPGRLDADDPWMRWPERETLGRDLCQQSFWHRIRGAMSRIRS